MSQIASQRVVAELAPTGVLRAGINMSNMLLVTGRTDVGRSGGRVARYGRRNRQAARRAGRLMSNTKSRRSWPTPPAPMLGISGSSAPSRRGRKRLRSPRPIARSRRPIWCRTNSPFKTAAEVDRTGVAHLGQARHGLRSVARTQYQARHRAALGHRRRAAQSIRRRQARGYGEPAAGIARGRQKGTRDQNPARQFHCGAAGDRHQQEQHGRRRVSCATLSRKLKDRGSWRG